MKAGKDKAQVSLNIMNKIYNEVPAFTDLFDEETWYIFAAFFTAATLILAFIASKFVKLKPVD